MRYLLFIFIYLVSFSQSKIIKAGFILDPNTGELKANQYILIENKRIVAVTDRIKQVADLEIIDLSQSILMPGLMDCHTHLCWHINDRKNDGYVLSIVREPTAYRAIQGVMNAKDMLLSGFTTVRDVGNAANYADTALRLAIEDGLVPGPTIINAGRIIAPFGGQRWVIPERRDYTQPEYFFADTRDELKKAIRENIHFGAKVIKLVVDDQKYIYSVDDIKFAIEEARLAGMRLAAHCSTKQGALNAIAAGVTTIEHGFGMDEETMVKCKKAGVALVTTTFSLPSLVSIQSDLSNPAAEDYKSGVETLRLAYKVGVTVPFGSDVIGKLEGHNRGEATLTFIQSYLDAGVSPLEIIQSMTIHASNAIGIDHERGFIKKGQFADIIAMKKNPIDDIWALKEIHFVMKEGEVYKTD